MYFSFTITINILLILLVFVIKHDMACIDPLKIRKLLCITKNCVIHGS